MRASNITFIDILPMIEYSPDFIAENILTRDQRVLIFGEPGAGKSTLATELARLLWTQGRQAHCISADPGSPLLGPPGAVCSGEWQGKEWTITALEALCSLDPGRFRLPLIMAVRRLAKKISFATLLVDAPGVIRGIAGSELLLGLVEAAHIDVILVLNRRKSGPPLSDELRATGAKVLVIQTSPLTRRPSKRERARQRTRRWDAYLADADERCIPLTGMQLLGTPPPPDVASAWTGRQIALLNRGQTRGLGEVLSKQGDDLQVRLSREAPGEVLLVRDAERGDDGLLNTAKPFAASITYYRPPPDIKPYTASDDANGPCPVVHVGAAVATLVNGIFGDPLLHLRLRHQRRSLLFDLGEGRRLPSRVAHQVSDVFISHAHIDHIGGFLWLLRSRVGDFAPCRIYGPPGIAGHIQGLVQGIHWDRVGEYGPRFEVMEAHDGRLLIFRIQAGKPERPFIGEIPEKDGILLEDPLFRVRAETLDHGIPVLAFAFEQPRQLNVRKERLTARGVEPGPWLGKLKLSIANDEPDTPILMPDGQVESAGTLAADLILITPGQKLVYATDLAATAGNRRRLATLARGADTLFCEASFIEEDNEQAERTGHLTARACAEIATEAGVSHLVPFHFSRRYEGEPERVYDEVREFCSRTVIPKPL